MKLDNVSVFCHKVSLELLLLFHKNVYIFRDFCSIFNTAEFPLNQMYIKLDMFFERCNHMYCKYFPTFILLSMLKHDKNLVI